MPVLLPLWDEEAPWGTGDLFGTANMLRDGGPQRWHVEFTKVSTVGEVEARALPTPLAWAGMMKAVLRNKGLREHVLFKSYEALLYGLVLGYLELEVVDVRKGKLGRVVVDTDDRFQYFGILKGSSRLERIKGVVFGATSPDTLFWPSPRPTQADWNALSTVRQEDPDLALARTVLADLREVVKGLGAWSVGDEDSPWVGAIDEMLGDTPPSAGRLLLASHTRTVGPILTRFPSIGHKPFYFPVVKRGFAARFIRSLTGTLREEEERVVALDDAKQPCFSIRRPSNIEAGGDHARLAGTGLVSADQPQDWEPRLERKALCLETTAGGKGLLSCFPALFDSRTLKVPDVKKAPLLYPDVVRVLIARLGEAALPGGKVVFSPAALENVFEPEFPGLPSIEGVGLTESWAGVVTKLPTGDRSLAHLETLGGHDVADLSALGRVLWLYFIGEADFEADTIRDSRSIPLIPKDGPAPLFADETVYADVRSGRASVRRLATLQRFVKAYAGSSPATHPEKSVEFLLGQAASTWARRCWGGQVLPMGHASAEQGTHTVTGVRVTLHRDRK